MRNLKKVTNELLYKTKAESRMSKTKYRVSLKGAVSGVLPQESRVELREDHVNISGMTG